MQGSLGSENSRHAEGNLGEDFRVGEEFLFFNGADWVGILGSGTYKAMGES